MRDLTRIRGIGPSRLIDIEAQGLACVGSEIRCEVYGRDRYQRALAVCYAGEVDLNGAMVRSGSALAWYPDGPPVAGPSYPIAAATPKAG